jgi:hypothetical protein
MNRSLIECGAVLCSTLVIYSWAQPSVSKATTQDCDATAKDTDSQKNCSPVLLSSSTTAAPEQLIEMQWGDRLPNDLEIVYDRLLKQAQVSASQEQFMQAVTDTTGIPKNSRHYAMAQQLREDWARELMRQATRECQKANVTNAIAMLNAIPLNSQFHPRATELKQNWTKQSRILERAIAAKKAGNWQAAIDAVQSLEEAPMYHSLLVQELLQQAVTKLHEPDQTLLQIATADLTVDYAAQ